jgi:hypothetical protein
MSSPSDRPDKNDDHAGFAPKRARDSDGEFSRRNENLIPNEGLIRDQARAHRPLDKTLAREARLAPPPWRARAESELPGGEESPLRMPRSLDPEFLREPPAAPRALGRFAVLLGCLVIAASIGAAIALFTAGGKLPSE